METTACGFILGVILAAILAAAIHDSNVRKYSYNAQDMLISECEKALPRNQKCVIVLSTRIENVEEK